MGAGILERAQRALTTARAGWKPDPTGLWWDLITPRPWARILGKAARDC